jgi:ATP-dependent helicase HepA
MSLFVPGQRIISDTELSMGLGTVVAVDFRSVTVLFLATDETRVYSQQSAPLTRVRFAVGDTVLSHEGWSLKIESIQEQNGLLTYYGTREDSTQAELEEGALDNSIQLSRPSERLFSSLIDSDKWFELRYLTRQHNNRLIHSELQGLTGIRASLIPHQLYIAHEIANRFAPRVLLADEVGLGKTIEAGLIIHHQLLTERAQRVLIIVPENLLHQWLVEMLRRFNLYFSLFDEERCLAIEASTGQSNPFDSEQLVLCSLQLFTEQSERFQQALEGNWDLLVVDEAHHLEWSQQHTSLEYGLIEQLAAKIQSLLLLTATPEQLGKASHFARLRLLDPERFPDFEAFVEEENNYQPIAKAVEILLSDQEINEKTYQILQTEMMEDDNHKLLNSLRDSNTKDIDKSNARNTIIDNLLDRHGTGRVLFRNTRATVKGFQKRILNSVALPLPIEYKQCIATFTKNKETEKKDSQLLFSPELIYQSSSDKSQVEWTSFDPRIAWLIDTLQQLKPNKILLITSSAKTVLDLASILRNKAGIHAAVFHENMSIIERDRSAAFFADKDSGSQVLLCSEIGSEGRNFQFSQHLILFDLPLNPDLLEQRIGRLDRIGQLKPINIIVPYFESSAQAVMTQWYHLGLDAFEHTCPTGHAVYTEMEKQLETALFNFHEQPDNVTSLISTTKELNEKLVIDLQHGRDRLLEYNSCRPSIANKLRDLAQKQDRESTLAQYLSKVFDCYGIDIEDDGDSNIIIRPSNHMLEGSFPKLPNEGMTITYARKTALAYEDIHYLTWEHPMVMEAMDLVLCSEAGNTAVTAIKYSGLKSGTLLLECLYIVDTASSAHLNSDRYLPPTTIRVVVDQRGLNHDQKLSHELINRLSATVQNEIAKKIVHTQRSILKELLQFGEKLAQDKLPDILVTAHKQAEQTLDKEISRLKALRLVNSNVRQAEIDFFETQLSGISSLLESANLRLDALRVVVVT